MEYGMNSTLKVHFLDIETSILDSIEFIFKQENKNDAKMKKYVVWNRNLVTDDVYTLDDDLTNFYIPFTKEDTFNFKPNKDFFIDARIHYIDTFDNPHVKVVGIPMLSGLFGEGDGN